MPKILDGTYYTNILPNAKTPGGIQATCTTCMSVISGTTKSTGNFLSHIKRRHKDILHQCQVYCQSKSNVVQIPPPSPMHMLNPLHLEVSTGDKALLHDQLFSRGIKKERA